MVKIVGHRGSMGGAFENTLASFQLAIEQGCDRTELDVHLSRDGVLVVFHDDDLYRLIEEDQRIVDLSLAEIQTFDLEGGHKIPTLQEVLDLCCGKIILQIELKAEGTAQAVVEMLKKNHMEDQVVITSFELEWLRMVKQLSPDSEVGGLFREVPIDLWKLVQSVPLDFIAPKSTIVTSDLIVEGHVHGTFVHAYGVNNKTRGQQLIKWGIDSMGTDFPDWFL